MPNPIFIALSSFQQSLISFLCGSGYFCTLHQSVLPSPRLHRTLVTSASLKAQASRCPLAEDHHSFWRRNPTHFHPSAKRSVLQPRLLSTPDIDFAGCSKYFSLSPAWGPLSTAIIRVMRVSASVLPSPKAALIACPGEEHPSEVILARWLRLFFFFSDRSASQLYPNNNVDPALSHCEEKKNMTTTTTFETPRQVVFFGDSITQLSHGPGGFASMVADHCIRRLDVVVRGLSGYNTRWCLHPDVFESIFTPALDPAIVVVFLGANDAVLKDRCPRQHVPLEEYAENLSEICARLRRVPTVQSNHRHAPSRL